MIICKGKESYRHLFTKRRIRTRWFFILLMVILWHGHTFFVEAAQISQYPLSDYWLKTEGIDQKEDDQDIIPIGGVFPSSYMKGLKHPKALKYAIQVTPPYHCPELLEVCL